MPKSRPAVAGLLLASALLAGGGHASAQGSGSPTLDAVKARGQLVCGVGGNVAGFSLADSQGVMRGLDADGCRALAAAVLGDASRVKFVPTTTQNRFTALQSGEVDVLVRETTWTLGREASLGLEFGVVNFYDGAGFLVPKSGKVTAGRQLDGATICVQPGTSTELAIADYFRVNNIKFTAVEIQDVQELRTAFLSGRCDAYSTDRSALATFRASQGDAAENLVLLPEIISKEPLGPMVRKGDDKWLDIVRWTAYAQIAAEEDGVSSKNVDGFANTADSNIRRLLGLEGGLGRALGLDSKWAYNVIKQVGNYGEIWDRDMAPLGLPRALNNLWNKGGLMYAPPIR